MLKIVFFGTPEFAASQLEAIIKDGRHSVEAVVTVPDKPAGRGKQLRESEVKLKAKEYGLPILQPEKLLNEDFLSQLRSFDADVFVVVAFRMLPEKVWAMPAKGTFNLHASLLPQYRGAAPINHAIINGETKTGVTTFLLDKEIDTGAILLQEETNILPEDNIGTLYDRLMLIGNGTVLRTLDMLEQGSFTAKRQDDIVDKNTILQPAPKIFKDDCVLNLNKGVTENHNLVRGLSPYPAVHVMLTNEAGVLLDIKILETCPERDEKSVGDVGDVVTDGKNFLKIKMSDGYLSILRLQQAGKKAMMVADFLRGMRFSGHFGVKM